MFDEHFEQALMDACVRQFFENPSMVGYTSDGTPVTVSPRPTPVQHVAAQLLTHRSDELLAKIIEQIDLDKVAADVAAKVAGILTEPDQSSRFGYGVRVDNTGKKIREALRERIDNRLVELIAQDTFTKMKEAELND